MIAGDKVKVIKPKLFLPIQAINFIIKNIYNIKKCILFLVDNNFI